MNNTQAGRLRVWEGLSAILVACCVLALRSQVRNFSLSQLDGHPSSTVTVLNTYQDFETTVSPPPGPFQTCFMLHA